MTSFHKISIALGVLVLSLLILLTSPLLGLDLTADLRAYLMVLVGTAVSFLGGLLMPQPNK